MEVLIYWLVILATVIAARIYSGGLCALKIHKWGKWGPAKAVTGYQERTCCKCNLVQHFSG